MSLCAEARTRNALPSGHNEATLGSQRVHRGDLPRLQLGGGGSAVETAAMIEQGRDAIAVEGFRIAQQAKKGSS